MKAMRNKIIIYEWGGMVALLLLVTVASALFQDVYSVYEGLGHDGRVYYQMALQAFNDQPFEQRTTFVYRQFTPWLAAAIAGQMSEIFPIFKYIGVTSAIITSFLLLLLLRYFINDWRLRLFLAALYPLHFMGPLRYSFFSPISTDPIMLLAITALLLVAQHFRSYPKDRNMCLVAATLFVFISVLTRSSSLPFALLLFFAISFSPSATTVRDKLWEKIAHVRPLLFVPFIAGLVAYFYVRQQAVVTGHYGAEFYNNHPYSLLLYNFNRLYTLPLMHYLQYIYTVWGPLFVLLLWQYRFVFNFLSNHWHITIFIVIPMIYATFAGDRQLIMTFPAYLILLGIVIQDKSDILKEKKWLCVVLIIAQLIAQRVFWTMPIDIPDEPQFTSPDTPIAFPHLFTPFTSDFHFYDMLAPENRGFYGHIVVAQHLLFSFFALIFLSDVYKRHSGKSIKSKKRK